MGLSSLASWRVAWHSSSVASRYRPDFYSDLLSSSQRSLLRSSSLFSVEVTSWLARPHSPTAPVPASLFGASWTRIRSNSYSSCMPVAAPTLEKEDLDHFGCFSLRALSQELQLGLFPSSPSLRSSLDCSRAVNAYLRLMPSPLRLSWGDYGPITEIT